MKRRAETNKKYAHLVPKLKELRAEGHTLVEIAQWLNDNGHFTRDGKAFTKPAVWRLFKRHAPECLGNIKSLARPGNRPWRRIVIHPFRAVIKQSHYV